MKTKALFFAMAMLFIISLAWAQSSSTATYTAGSVVVVCTFEAEPNLTSYSSTSLDLNVTIPVGVRITSVDVSYNMTCIWGYEADGMRSYLRCNNSGGLTESSMTTGYSFPSNDPYTIAYNRTGLTIANGVTSGGNISFTLHPFMLYHLNTTTVDNNTFSVTVHYTPNATPSSFRVAPLNSTTLKATWNSSYPALLVYNSTNSFSEPSDGVSYSAGSTIGTATVLYAGDLQEFTHNNLTPQTTYYYKIWSYSGNYLYSNGASNSGFTTDPVDCPINADFDSSASFLPAGWSNTTTFIIPWIYSSAANPGPHSGAGMAVLMPPSQFMQRTSSLITPLIRFPGTRYQLSFWMYRNNLGNTASYLQVLLNSAPNESGATEIQKIMMRPTLSPVESGGNGWYRYSYMLNDFGVNPGYFCYVIFKGNNPGSSVSMFIDEIKIDQLPDLPQGEATEVGGLSIQPSEDLDLDNDIDETHPIITGLPTYANLGDMMVLGLSGTGNSVDIDVTAPAGNWYGSIYYSGEWHESDPVFIGEDDASRIFSFTGVDFTAKDGEVIILLSEGDPSTLPVELSSFNAVLTAQNYVKLNWISQSETNLLGYYLYRSAVSDLSSGTMISGQIPATNTSSQQSYTFVDSEIYESGQYYYWLQSTEMDGSVNFHGPITILVNLDGENPETPEIPLETSLRSIYPNPFNPSTTISYQLRTPGAVNFGIYNARGQMVRTIETSHSTPGIYSVVFDGRDNNGGTVASGIYYVKMKTDSYRSMQKMVLKK